MKELTQMKFKIKIKPIRNEADDQKAHERLDVIFYVKRGIEEGDELEILAMVIDNFENENFPCDMPDPISSINFRMEQMGLKHKGSFKMIGFKS